MNFKIENWIRGTVELLVDSPEQVEVEITEGNIVTTISCRVAKPDIGKLIGKHGIMADAFRTFLNGIGGKMDKKYLLHIEG